MTHPHVPQISPEQHRAQYNKDRGYSFLSYVAAETLFKTLKRGQKIWIGDNLLFLRLQGYTITKAEGVVIPAVNANVIAAIGPVATLITLDHIDHMGGFTKDVLSYNMVDAFLYASLKKPH